MNLIYVLTNKEKLLKKFKKIICGSCGEMYYSKIHKLYILVKGQCYNCSPNDILFRNIVRSENENN